jgi:hypothetical protein
MTDSSFFWAFLINVSSGAGNARVVCVGAGSFLGSTAFSPLTTGVLVKTSGKKCAPGEQSAEGIEQQQIGLEIANLGDDERPFASFRFDKHAASTIDNRGRIPRRSAADVLTHDATIHAPRARVIGTALSACFPGHEGGFSKRRNRRGATQS